MEKDMYVVPKPNKSVYVLHSHNSWEKECRRRKKDMLGLEGFFIPRTLVANLKKHSNYLILNFFHEYIGHGAFVEFSKIGQKMLNYEQELQEIEDDSTRINKGTKQYDDYVNVLNLYDNYLLQTKNIYEGYANWLSDYLGKENGLEQLTFQKRKFLSTNMVKIMESMNNFVKKNNVSALVEMVFEFS